MKWNEFSTWKTQFKAALRALGLLLLLYGVFLAVFKTVQYWDDDPDRGGLVINTAKFNDSYDTLYPNRDSDEETRHWQGWSPGESMWFYTTTQGSDLIPYDFFMVLEAKDTRELFRSNKRMDGYRYIVLKPTFSNPDGLPLGFVKDTYKSKDYVGFTCAACHTAQINYNKVAMRIDGAPAMADMETFIEDLSEALSQTYKDEAKRKRFVEAVLNRNGFFRIFNGGRDYTSEEEVLEDLKKFNSRLFVYKTINKSTLSYGYARLDAFGRIFNRTLQHVLTRKDLQEVLAKRLSREEVRNVLKKFDEEVLSDNRFDHILERLLPLLSEEEFIQVSREIFSSPNGPVSYPYMWDAPQHDYLQWNGIAPNSGTGPLARNTGEVIGVFGTLDWQEKEAVTLSSIILGNTSKKISFDSSVDAYNLERLENQLHDLYSPVWPEEVLGKIDQESAERGEKLFNEYCVTCHHSFDRTRSNRKIIANFTNVPDIGTDPIMATNALTAAGYSGILFETYYKTNLGNLHIQDRAPVALLFLSVTKNVIATPDPDKWFLRRWYDWLYNIIATSLSNKVQPSLRGGNYIPSTTAAPFNELFAYKSRPLNGIWASAPYLHNGSVPTLYDLLLPSRRDLLEHGKTPQPNGKYRPDKFLVGSRRFDPRKVGFITTGYDGFLFDTSLPGNQNTGHNFGLDRLTEQDRWDLVEYMKTL